MKLGVHTDMEALQVPVKCHLDLPELNDGTDEKVYLWIRPWTRTAQAIVAKKAKLKGEISDEELRAAGTGDLDSERYTRSLANFLLTDWENVTDVNKVSDEFPQGEPLECNERNKMALFEDLQVALWVVEKAKTLATKKLPGDLKNSAG